MLYRGARGKFQRATTHRQKLHHGTIINHCDRGDRSVAESTERGSRIGDTIARVQRKSERQTFALTPQGLLIRDEGGQKKLVVPTSLRMQVFNTCHDQPTVGHVGKHRTLELAWRKYWWKAMGKEIEAYVRSCPICQVMKSDHRKKTGLLQPIPIPTRKWEQITTDLVTDLPPSDGYTAVAVFVNRLSEMVHFSHARKKLQQTSMPSSLWTMSSNFMVPLKLSFQIEVLDLRAGSALSFSRYSVRISDSAQRFILRRMDRARSLYAC